MVRPRVFFDITVDGTPLGRVIFELYSDSAPKTTENFRALCTGEKGLSSVSEHPLYYKNSIIHRSIRDFMIQGGDFTRRNGTGGESIYGNVFADEDLSRPLNSEGLLCMANKGPNTNGSQFFITLRDCPHLSGKHVVFGKVIQGYEDVIKRLAQVPVDEKDRPKTLITIANCGELELRSKNTLGGYQKQSSKGLSDIQSPSIDVKKTSRKRREARDTDTEESWRQQKKSKYKNHRSTPQDRPDGQGSQIDTNPAVETEEEYDARLEREERQRLEATRIRELERIKKNHTYMSQDEGGIRFKGRGRMKFIDPDFRSGR